MSITSSNFFGHTVTLNVPTDHTMLVWGSERHIFTFDGATLANLSDDKLTEVTYGGIIINVNIIGS